MKASWRIGMATACVAAAMLVNCPQAVSAEPAATQFEINVPASQNLRGFGRVEVDYAIHTAAGQPVWELTFKCESPQKAAVVAGKFLADLDLSPGITKDEITVGQSKMPVLITAAGSAFCAAIQGSQARIVSAARKETLAAFAAERSERLQDAVAEAAYPAFLDRFDRWGWGLYGFQGYRGGWQEHIKQPPDDDGPKTPTEDIAWLAKNGFRFEGWLDPAMSHVNSDGIIRNTESEWVVREAARLKLPLSFRLYGSQLANENDWTNRRFGPYIQEPAPFLMRYIDSYSSWCEVSWFAPDIHKYQAVKTMEQMRQYNKEPLALGWMHPYGEFSAGEWRHDHADYSPHAQTAWRAYLRSKGLDLAEVSRVYGRTMRPFGDWSQVEVPEFATFAGLDGQVRDLGGDWWYRFENKTDFKPDENWWKKSAEERYAGLKEKWWEGSVGAEWTAIRAPIGDGLTNLYGFRRDNNESTTWFRRSFTLTPAQLAPTLPPPSTSSPDPRTPNPIYLYWFPISFGGIHSGERARFHDIFINGQKVGEIGHWGAIDVTAALRPGDNQIALHMHGTKWDGRIFLSTEAPRIYPYLGEAKNTLWNLWRNWLLDGRVGAISTVLDGMRQVDPDRPIKYMAPIPLGSQRWLKLAYNWGGFAHFTGEGMWFFPWYKRYSYLYGLPGSSETAGPPNPKPDPLPDQFDSFRRVFLAGLNAHDPVFVAEWYTRHPALRKWWETHNPVLKQLGKFDLHGPQVLLYRGTLMDLKIVPEQPYPKLGEATRKIQTPWDWDLGRGTLQTIGQSYCYLDDGGLADGKMNGYDVMIDSGNEIMPAESVGRIADWVKGGGTFVALPFTGRNSLTEPDCWQLRPLTGCEIGPLCKPGNGTVTIGKDQKVFKALAGKSFPDNGRSMDWVGNNLNLYSVELKPGPDCEVLATYENGAAAIVKRPLGKGSVIILGSTFWRNSQDRRGVWWPEPNETEFVADLLAGVGYPAAPCVTSDRLVWPQPYRSNNGQDLVAVLVSWNDDKEVATTLRLRTPVKPTKLVCFGVDGEKELPFEWKDGEAVTTVAMPAKEVKVVRALGCLDPFSAVSHWWNYQQRIWHEIATPTIDLEPYTRGQWADPTLDLRPDARLTTTTPADTAWQLPGFDDAAWKPCPMTILNSYGAEPNKPLWLRKSFTLPPNWKGKGGSIRLVSGACWAARYVGSARLFLNGVMLHDFGGEFTDADVTAIARDGVNVVALEFKGDKEAQGVLGQVYLYHRPAPDLSIPLNGEWRVKDEKGAFSNVTLPGKSDLMRPTRSVFIPKEWEGKYRVRLYMEGHRYQIMRVTVNGDLMRRGVPNDQPADFDITALVKFGQDNELVLTTISRKEPWDIRIVRLDLFAEGK